MIRTALLIASLLLAGCAHTKTGPLLAGQDTYIVSIQGGALPTGKEPLLEEAIAEANTKCSSEHKKMQLVTATENPGPYVLGNYPKATVVFKCE